MTIQLLSTLNHILQPAPSPDVATPLMRPHFFLRKLYLLVFAQSHFAKRVHLLNGCTKGRYPYFNLTNLPLR